MNFEDPRSVAAGWSNIAEPGDVWAGALRQELGASDALRWAHDPFNPLPHSVEGPGGQSGKGAAPGWRAAHKRWQPRFYDLDVERDLAQLQTLGGRLVVPGDDEWPDQLEDLEFRVPPALWVLGNARLRAKDEPSVAVVGARSATQYGVRVSSEMAFDLGEAGITVVSGGAYGVDAAAHRGALDAYVEKGKKSGTLGGVTARVHPSTVAIVCGGLANLYPQGNENLFRRITAEGGAIVAEVPPRFRPARWRFLERNRLIAAWADVTVVPEAGLRSGALATANRALELGRDVGAVPGPITSFASAGPHSLIQDGAALVESARDVIELMVGVDNQPRQRDTTGQPPSRNPHAPSVIVEAKLKGLGPVARRVYEALPATSSATTSSVVRAAGLSSEDVGGALLSLRLADLVCRDGQKWARAA